MNTAGTLSCTLILSVLGACAHHRDVRPMDGGVHYVAIKMERTDEGYHDAMSQAKDYCAQFNKSPVQVSEKNEYIGGIDEETYNTAKTVSNVAKTVGSLGYIFGGQNESRVGGVAAIGGVVTDGALGQGYRYTMHFRCQ